MEYQCIETTERAITKLVGDFQSYPDSFWNERDLHWSLFYCLKQEEAIQGDSVTRLIHAEFPTFTRYGKNLLDVFLAIFWTTKFARGHHDLVILDPESYNSPVMQRLKSEAPWGDFPKQMKVAMAKVPGKGPMVRNVLEIEFLKLVKIAVAVEIKLWPARLKPDRADWDIQKLTRQPTNILNAFFLNFVQLDFRRGRNREYYEKLRDYLTSRKRQWPNLRILCVPSDVRIQPKPARNWI